MPRTLTLRARWIVIGYCREAVRILAFAYACRPDEGSEPGAGWIWVRMLARLGDVCVVTRSDNSEYIEREIANLPERNALTFVYIDPVGGCRPAPLLLKSIRYLSWQYRAWLRARELDSVCQFDLSWHLTYANAWIGTLACLIGRDFILGPVGGCVTTPWRLLPALGMKAAVRELGRTVLRRCARAFNPLARVSWRRAVLVLAQSDETANWFPRRYRSKVHIFQNTVMDFVPAPPRDPPSGRGLAVYSGRLIPLKAVGLAIRAVVASPDWRLEIWGSGPDQPRLERLVRRLDAEDRVVFRGWRPHEEIQKILREGQVDAFIFPSVRDEGSWAVAEAVNANIPVICLDRGGPPVIVGESGYVAPIGKPSSVVRSLTNLLDESRQGLRPSPSGPRFSPDQRLKELSALLLYAMGVPFEENRPVEWQMR